MTPSDPPPTLWGTSATFLTLELSYIEGAGLLALVGDGERESPFRVPCITALFLFYSC